MVRKQLIAPLAFFALSLAGTAAMADDITMANEAFMSTKTRAEVRAEVLAAQAAGTLRVNDIEGYVARGERSMLTREAVRAQAAMTSAAARIAFLMQYPA